jgi:type IV secretory pathway component VirB8
MLFNATSSAMPSASTRSRVQEYQLHRSTGVQPLPGTAMCKGEHNEQQTVTTFANACMTLTMLSSKVAAQDIVSVVFIHKLLHKQQQGVDAQMQHSNYAHLLTYDYALDQSHHGKNSSLHDADCERL